MTISRRTVLAAMSSLLAVPVLASCASDSDAGAAPASSTGAEPAGDAFPATIKHKYGETVIEEAPSRVVCVGYTEQDALLALGVVPVGTSDWFGDDVPGRIYPWAVDKLADAPVPEVLPTDDGVPFEKVAALGPDLIVAQYSGLTEAEYQRLTKIAPTLAQPGEYVDWGAPWDVITRNVGAAVGKSAEAEALVTSVNDAIAKAAADNADAFAGQTGVVATAYEGIWIYGPQDPRGRLLQELGFSFPKQLENPDTKEFGWSISVERASDLADVGVVVWISSDEVIKQEIGKVWEATTAAKQGRAVYLDSEKSPTYSTAFSFVTPLSIPYVLERYVPQLIAAADGDPATAVPVVTD